MTIKRVINGSSVEIELDDRELYEAYLEKQAKFDEDDVRDVFNGFSDDVRIIALSCQISIGFLHLLTIGGLGIKSPLP